MARNLKKEVINIAKEYLVRYLTTSMLHNEVVKHEIKKHTWSPFHYCTL